MDSSFDQEDIENPDSEPVGIEDEFTAMAAEMSLGTWLEFDIGDKKRRGETGMEKRGHGGVCVRGPQV